MKHGILFSLLVLVALSCKDDNNEVACGFANPIKEIDWLREAIENGGYKTSTSADTFVYKATYDGQTVIYISVCCPSCSVTPPEIRKCNGDVLGQLGVDIDSDDLKNQKLLWRTENGICP